MLGNSYCNWTGNLFRNKTVLNIGSLTFTIFINFVVYFAKKLVINYS